MSRCEKLESQCDVLITSDPYLTSAIGNNQAPRKDSRASSTNKSKRGQTYMDISGITYILSFVSVSSCPVTMDITLRIPHPYFDSKFKRIPLNLL